MTLPKVPIVCFLQNAHCKDPQKYARVLESMVRQFGYWDARRRLTHFALFRGCRTGRVLESVFAAPKTMVWEEASPKVGGHSSSCFGYDVGHMKSAVEHWKPDLIYCFGKVACDGARAAGFQFVDFVHPTARGVDTRKSIESRLGAFCSDSG